MPRARYNVTTTATALPDRGSGRFSGYIIPPLSVLIMGSLLAFFALNFTPQDLTARAASGSIETNPILESALGAFLPDPATAVPQHQLNNSSNEPFVDSNPIPRQPVAPPQAALQMTFPNDALVAAPAATTELSPVFTPEVQYWGKSITTWASAAGIDPNLAAVVMQIESCGDPSATSGSGAMGLFQVMPFHFASDDAPYEPDTNAVRGLDYLRRSLQAANNDARLAFAGYNGGIGVISRAEWMWPAETIRYAYWASGIYEDAISGKKQSPRLQEWLDAGGSGLCAEASQRLGLGK